MSESGNILLLADRPVAEELAAHFRDGHCLHVADPYEALAEMGRRRWPAIIVTAPRPDLPGLARAARRLQADARLFAVCSPAAEPEVRGLVGKLLDDYFIYPLTQRELADLRRAGELAGGPGRQETDKAAPLAARQLADLIESAKSVANLEMHLAGAVGSLVSAPVSWVNADEVPQGTQPLLLAAAPGALPDLAGEAASAAFVPRVLVPEGTSRKPDAAAAAALAILQQCLPALLASARRTEGLHRLAITDHLTGAYNRRFFYHMTEQILQRARREEFRVTLLLYDIDDFKRYNDAYGHAAGDEILRDTAALMKQITRSQDLVARIGGDEFAVLFWDDERPRIPDSRPPESAYVLADRFRRAVQTHEFGSLGPEAKGTLTISGGLASHPDGGRNVRELLRTADTALQKAKDSGKNAIYLIGQGG